MIYSTSQLRKLVCLLIVYLIIMFNTEAQSSFQYVAVKNQENKWGFINEKYEVAIPFMYDYAMNFSMNLGWVKSDGKFHCINKDNEIVFSTDYDEVHPFKEGSALFIKNNKYGFVDLTGKVVVEPVYDNASDFSDGLARVKKGGYFGYIDYNGFVVIAFEYIDASDFSNGIAVVENKYFINKQGKMLFENKKFSRAMPFSEGLAAVSQARPYVFGYIDTTGKLIIAYQYIEAGPFSEGFAVVKPVNEYNGFIDKEGKALTKFQYYVAESFSDGVALTGEIVGGEEGSNQMKITYIDNKAKKIFPSVIVEDASSFRQGIAFITLKGKNIIINKHGKCVYNCTE